MILDSPWRGQCSIHAKMPTGCNPWALIGELIQYVILRGLITLTVPD